MSATPIPVEPFLARHAVVRQVGPELPGFYDDHLSLWIVETDEGRLPLVEAGLSLRELETKTKVDNEQDDTAAHALGSSGATETAVGHEQDDTSMLVLLAATFTEVKTEADDLA